MSERVTVNNTEQSAVTANTIEDRKTTVQNGSIGTENQAEQTLSEKEPENSRPVSAPEDPGPVHRSLFVKFLLCCVSFLAVFGIVNLVFYKLGMEPFGSKTVAIYDAKIQYIDFFTYFVDILKGERSLAYDFSNMLGGSSIGLFSYYLASPFNLLLAYFGKEGVYRFFDVAVALKIATAGSTFCWYLQRRFADRIRPVFVIALSMGYALMQYQLLQSSNIMWLDGVYMLPLMLLGVYEVLHRKTVWRLVLTVTFCIFCNWYIAGVNCLFTGVWFLFEYFFQDEIMEGRKPRTYAVVDRRYSGRRRRASGAQLGVTDFVVSCCRYGWGMGLGIAMSAILFLPTISAMRLGKGQYDSFEFTMQFIGDLLSPIRGYVIGTKGTYGNAALFCGGIAVFGSLALIFSGSCKIRQKIAYLLLLVVCYLMLHWEPAMMLFSLMKRVDSYWYRYSYLIGFALLFGAGAYLSRAEKDRWSKIFVILLSLLFSAGIFILNGVHLSDLTEQGLGLMKDHKMLFITAGSCIILSVLTLVLLCVKPRAGKGFGGRGIVRLAAGLLLLAVTAGELSLNAWMFWRNHTDDSQELYMAYSEGMQKQLAQLRAVDGGYYRIAQDRTRWHNEDDLTAFLNDSLAQNYWSNTAYTSSPDNAQISLMWKLGYRDEAGCMMIVRDPVLASDSFLGVKYYLESTPVQGIEAVEGVEPFNGRTVYKNPYVLPMAFTYDGSKLPTMRYDSTFVYQNALFSVLSGKKTELYTPLSWSQEIKENKNYFNVYVPKGNYLAYGNLLWSGTGKMTGLMSINGADPFGYCRWESPAAFLIRSRAEQAQSTVSESLQAQMSESGSSEEDLENSQTGASSSSKQTDIEVHEQKIELQETAAAYDQKVLATLDKESYADVRTVVFRSDELAPFSDCQFYGLNLDVLKEAVDRIRTGAVDEENLTMENGHVTCTLEGRNGQSLCLLVPYTKGWQAFRNGEPVNTDIVAGTMITIPLVNGQNEIELKYEVPYLKVGFYISAATAGVLLLDILIRLITRRKKRR